MTARVETTNLGYSTVIHTIGDIPAQWLASSDSIDLSALPDREAHNGVVMVEPYEYAIVPNNPHCDTSALIDPVQVHEQWQALANAHRSAAMRVHALTRDWIEAAKCRAGVTTQLPDIVFNRNHGIPFIDREGVKVFALSRMTAQGRPDEVNVMQEFYREHGFRFIPPPEGIQFEGMGDALWHPGKNIIWGHHGFRTDAAIYPFLAQVTGAAVMSLQLTNENYYHGDTALCLLDAATAMVVPHAYKPEGLALIKKFFPHLLELTDSEAMLFAANAHCPNERDVIIHDEAHLSRVYEWLGERGFTVHKVDTSLFIKAGGSVFCMEMAFPE